MARTVRKAKAGAMSAEVAADADIRGIMDSGGATVEPAAGAVAETGTVPETAATAASGAAVFIPLGKLKKSLRNARKTPHSPATIEALAASIAG